MKTPDSRVILCEHGRKWATVLRRLLNTPICETRFDEAIESELAESPFAVVVRETSPTTMASAVEFFYSTSRQFPHAALIAVGNSRIAPYANILMAAGADFVCSSLRRVEPIMGIVARQQVPPANVLPLDV